MRRTLVLITLLAAGPAAAQSLPSIPSLPSLPGIGGGGGSSSTSVPNIPGLGQQQTPDQRRAFCQRVGDAASRCGVSLDVMALSACVIRTLPAEDSMRVAQVANNARGNAGSVLSECGIGVR